MGVPFGEISLPWGCSRKLKEYPQSERYSHLRQLSLDHLSPLDDLPLFLTLMAMLEMASLSFVVMGQIKG